MKRVVSYDHRHKHALQEFKSDWDRKSCHNGSRHVRYKEQSRTLDTHLNSNASTFD